MATKLVTGGGIYINLTKIISATEKVCPNQHALHGQLTILRKGMFMLVHFASLLQLSCSCREKAISFDKMDLIKF